MGKLVVSCKNPHQLRRSLEEPRLLWGSWKNLLGAIVSAKNPKVEWKWSKNVEDLRRTLVDPPNFLEYSLVSICNFLFIIARVYVFRCKNRRPVTLLCTDNSVLRPRLL